MTEIELEVKDLPVGLLEVNRGQVYGLPKNPRFIKDERFEKLKKSITDDPEYMRVRELVVWRMDDSDKYIIIGGNMRYRACIDLGWETIPCKILPKETPVAKLRAYVIKDNEAFGNTDWDIIANEWDTEELTEWGMEGVDFLMDTNNESDIDSLFEEANNTEEKHKNIHITVELPEELTEQQEEITNIIKEALAEYEGIKIK